jgi:hypothetical protein
MIFFFTPIEMIMAEMMSGMNMGGKSKTGKKKDKYY